MQKRKWLRIQIKKKNPFTLAYFRKETNVFREITV